MVKAGLEDIVAATSTICDVIGKEGRLIYQGYDIHDLAQQSSFEEVETKSLDIALILHADHELNASTFAARVAAATETDIYSAIVAAIGTLAGPLHGGANQEVIKMLLKIGELNNVEPFIKQMIEE